MTRQRNCRDCKKELTDKYYIITCVGAYEASRANFCFLCCEKKKNIRLIKKLIEEGLEKVIEKKVGDKLYDDISDFEDKWEKNTNLGITKKILPDNKTLLNSIRQARQELEPYLYKSEIVEKAWLKEYVDYIDMSFYYLFAKSAREKNYKQKVVQPIVEKILGEKLDEEINTATKGGVPGDSSVPGRADGDFIINGKLIGKYNWVDHEDDCRRLGLSFWEDNSLALRAFLKSLDIKEKELMKITELQNPENPNILHQKTIHSGNQPQKSSNHSNSTKPTNWVLIIGLTISGVIIFFGIVIFLIKTRKKK
ncbi:hypothetical protein [endosymbiont GvMRE of Glomus versiforme]|uniref:hypothetical protein n=1 Tax=endosymbiont GvMRE of Glomus versiforme TaxID=2039283 RepID=UPI000ED5363E|nr:hypothetical protein [endosymbiont GvMRE of Glomus versiforme]RHZ37467.1 hypothetical protein GvMRE_I1g671 [endosymbiont GvMRE of Glomus versiforme]